MKAIPVSAPPRAVPALCALLLAACSGGGKAAEDVPSGPPLTSFSVPGWSVEHAAQAGGADAGRDQQLYTVVSVAEDPEGRVYALNFGDKRVVVFDTTGRFVRSIGKTGKGPGEFTSPTRLAVVGSDGLYVMDPLQRRISRFRRSDGSHLSDLPLSVGTGFIPREMRAAAGRVLVELRPARTARSKGPVRPRVVPVDTVTGAPLYPQEVVLDTISQVEVRTPHGKVMRAMVMDIPFAPRPLWALDPAGNVLFGSGSRYMLFRAAGGRTEMAMRGEGERIPVTREDQERLFREAAMKPFEGKVAFPDQKPYFTALVADGGRVWFRVPSARPGNRWEIRDGAGRKLGEVLLAANADLMHVSPTSMYVVQTDADDVETLHRYRLRRTP